MKKGVVYTLRRLQGVAQAGYPTTQDCHENVPEKLTVSVMMANLIIRSDCVSLKSGLISQTLLRTRVAQDPTGLMFTTAFESGPVQLLGRREDTGLWSMISSMQSLNSISGLVAY